MSQQAGLPEFDSVPAMLRELAPVAPVYCVYPERYRAAARFFLQNFPGRVLYAVKANDEPAIVRLLYDAGIRHFDCASLPEITLVNELCPAATCYFMIPVRLRGAAGEAQRRHGVKHFVVDLPVDVRAGDHIEFTELGAYSLSGRTRFNGHYSDTIVSIRAG